MSQDFLHEILTQKSMIICGGSGGVGKTTTSAVLALQAAVLGRKVLVLTIDPAKRLANSLGLEALGNKICRIDSELLKQAGLDVKGELSAMMLDSKRTFDAMVEKLAPSSERAKSILENNYYQHISRALTGTHEYMAMETLYEIHEKGEFDLIVLDTPPTHNALDFLDAPARITRFLDDSVLKWFLKPYFLAGKFSLKTAKVGSKMIFKVLEKVTGVQVLKDISEFFVAFSGMFGGFKERAENVSAMLKNKDTAFVLVTSPNPITVKECIFFHNKLLEQDLPFGGVIVNKVHPNYHFDENIAVESIQEEIQKVGISVDLAGRLAETLEHFRALYDLDREAIEELRSDTSMDDLHIRRVRYFDDDIFAIGELKLMVDELFAKAA